MLPARMTHFETIMHMLLIAEQEMLHVRGIELESNRFDQLLVEAAEQYGWSLQRTESSFQLHGPRGYVTIRRGE